MISVGVILKVVSVTVIALRVIVIEVVVMMA